MGPISAKLFFAPGWTEMNIERWIGKDEEKTNIEHPTSNIESKKERSRDG
jgi:hypothetical protein